MYNKSCHIFVVFSLYKNGQDLFGLTVVLQVHYLIAPRCHLNDLCSELLLFSDYGVFVRANNSSGFGSRRAGRSGRKGEGLCAHAR